MVKVHVVVDLNYGDLIRDLPVGEPAWIVDSPDNQLIIENVRKAHPELNSLTGITSFKSGAQMKPDDRLINILSTIDLHHGEYSSDPPYSILNIIGVEWSKKIQEELSRFGFNSHKATHQGFIAKRGLDERPS